MSTRQTLRTLTRPALVAAMIAASASAAPNAPSPLQPEKPASAPSPTPTPTPTPASAGDKGGQPEKPAQPTKPGAKPSDDPAVDDIIKDLQKPAAEPKPANPAPKPAVIAPSATPIAAERPAGRAAAAQPARLVREGTFIVSRKGRLVRGASGDWLFAFDSDTDQRTGKDPQMALLPCEKLMSMERVAEKHGDDVAFTLTGQVFVYHGRNYIMPTNYVVNRPSSDIKPLQ
ncbi:MAG: hypothetical protein AB7G11_07740 [Phycisphaerales bacterium]